MLSFCGGVGGGGVLGGGVMSNPTTVLRLCCGRAVTIFLEISYY